MTVEKEKMKELGRRSSYPSHHAKHPEEIWLGTRRLPEGPIRSSPKALAAPTRAGKELLCSVLAGKAG